MKGRVIVMGNIAVLKVISGRPGDADTGLILHGVDQCLALADELMEAAETIKGNEKKYSFDELRERRKF